MFQENKDWYYWLNQGNIFNDNNKLLEAIECYDAAIRFQPDCADAYNNKGNALSSLGRNLEAIDYYDATISLQPDFAEAYNGKGAALSSLGRDLEAVEWYDAAIRLKIDFLYAYNNKGRSLRVLGRNLEALECYDAAINLKPDDPSAYSNKGYTLYRLGRNLEAIEFYDAAIWLKPNDASIYSNKGMALYNLGRNLEAIECYDAAISLMPNLKEAYNNKGNALRGLGRNLEAIECYSIAIRLDPNYPLYYCNRAKTFNDLGREREAMDDFNKAYAIMLEQQHCGSALSNGNMALINTALSQDRLLLLNKISELQKIALEFKEELQQLESNFGDNTQLYKEIDDNYARIENRKAEIIKNVVDLIESKNQDQELRQNVSNANDQIKILSEELSRLRNEMKCVAEQKISRSEIESYAIKINPEIEKKPELKNYFDALYDRLHCALNEAEVICGGRNVAINNPSAKVFALSKAIELTPFFGGLISNTFSLVTEKINENSVRRYAVKLKSAMGSNPGERESTIKKAAEMITLNSKDRLDSIETNLEVAYWINKGIIAKCKDFFIVDADYMMHQNKPQILGCIDALKIIHAIDDNKITQNSSSDLTVMQMAIVPYTYKFTKGNTVSANREQKVCCKIFYINQIVYANPLLNKPNLLKELSTAKGLPIFKVLDCYNAFMKFDLDVE